METTENIPVDSVERRRLQNRNAQRKFRQKRSLQRAIEAAQAESKSQSSFAPESHAAFPWLCQDLDSTLPSFTSTSINQQQQHFTFDTQESITSPVLNLDDASYFTANPGTVDLPGLSASQSLTSSALLQSADLNFDFINAGRTSLGSYTPSDGSIGDGLPSPSSFSNAVSSSRHHLPTMAFAAQRPQSQPRQSSCTSGSDTHGDVNRHSGTTTQIPGSGLAIEEDWLGTLHIAAQRGRDRIVRLLLQSNIGVDSRDSAGRTALHYAVMEGHEAVVRELLAHGARMDEPDDDLRATLHYAALSRHESILRILLNHAQGGLKARIDGFDKNGWTPLHLAVERGFETGVQLLLLCGADLNAKAKRCPHTGNVIPQDLFRL